VNSPAFEFCGLGDGNLALNDRGRTVALVTRHGYIDWILRSPAEEGPRFDRMTAGTHPGDVLGLRLALCLPSLTEANMTDIRGEPGGNGATATLLGEAVSGDGSFSSRTIATLRVNARTNWYEWDLVTTARCLADKPVNLSWIEYNSIYPASCGRRMLLAPEKRYHSTMLVDSAGVVWAFPHQHVLHYGAKIRQLHFGQSSVAGFFGEQGGSPVCVLRESSLEPDWDICSKSYSLRCGSRCSAPVRPGQEMRWRYSVKYLTPAQSRPLLQAARPIPVTAADWQRHTCPRLELGLNYFDSPVMLDRLDEASAFRPRPPKMVWDRQIGHQRKGALRIAHTADEETIWSAEPPAQIPADGRLTLAGLIMTRNVEGKGMYLRVRCQPCDWSPVPPAEWPVTLSSKPVNGSTDGWVRVNVPLLKPPPETSGCLLRIDVILDGKGTGWLTDLDVDLVRIPKSVPAQV